MKNLRVYFLCVFVNFSTCLIFTNSSYAQCKDPLVVSYSIPSVKNLLAAISEKSIPAFHDKFKKILGCQIEVIDIPLIRTTEYFANKQIDISIGRRQNEELDEVAEFFPYLDLGMNLLVPKDDKKINSYKDFLNIVENTSDFNLGVYRGQIIPPGSLEESINMLAEKKLVFHFTQITTLAQMMKLNRLNALLVPSLVFYLEPENRGKLSEFKDIPVPFATPPSGFYVSKKLLANISEKQKIALFNFLRKTNKERGLKPYFEYAMGKETHKKYFNKPATSASFQEHASPPYKPSSK